MSNPVRRPFAGLANTWRRRLLPHLFTLALVLLAAAPALTGLRLERLYQRGLADLTARGWQVIEHDWRHGWFDATALTVLAPPGQIGDAAPRLRIATRITQGPRWADLGAGPLPLATGNARITMLDAPRPLPPLRVAFWLGLDGAPSARFSLPDVTYSGALGQLQLRDGATNLALTDGAHRLSGSGRLGALLITAPDGGEIDLRNIDWRLALAFTADGLPVGDLLFTLGRLRLGGPAEQAPAADAPATARQPPATLEAAGLRLGLALGRGPALAAGGTATGDPQARLTLTAALELDWLRLNGIDLAPARLVFALTDLDAAELAGLRADWQAIAARRLTSSQRGLAQGELLAQRLPALLATQPQLRGEPLELRTPDGAVSARLLLGLTPPDATDPGAAHPSNATFWLRQLTGEASIALPQPLVRRWLLERGRGRAMEELARLGADPQALPPGLEAELGAAADAALAGLLRERWLIASGGRYSAQLLIGDGLLTINGRTVSVQ